MNNALSTACQAAYIIVSGKAPVRTGNLRYNAVQYTEEDKQATILVDESIAPYMKYTNEHWSKFRPPLYGKLNPNYMWWNKSVELAIQAVATILNAEVIKE